MKRNFFIILLLAATGCASPIGVTRVQNRSTYRETPAGAGGAKALTSDTQAALQRYEVSSLYDRDPQAAVNRLLAIATEKSSPDALLALSETSHVAARQFQKYTWTRVNDKMIRGIDAARAYNYLSALAAYFYLFPSNGESMDPNAVREPLARSLYNHALADALKIPGSDRVKFPKSALDLTSDKLQFEVTRPGFPWSDRQCHDFIASDEYVVRGLNQRVREPGLGVPLIAIPDHTAF